ACALPISPDVVRVEGHLRALAVDELGIAFALRRQLPVPVRLEVGKGDRAFDRGFHPPAFVVKPLGDRHDSSSLPDTQWAPVPVPRNRRPARAGGPPARTVCYQPTSAAAPVHRGMPRPSPAPGAPARP